MSVLKKSFCLLISFSILLQVCGCSHKEENDPVVIDTNCDMTSEDYVCGNGDVEDLYFKSVRCTVPQQVDINGCVVLKTGENVLVIAEDANRDNKEVKIKGNIISFDGELISTFTFDDNSIYIPVMEGTFADWNGEYIITAKEGDAYLIFDHEGKMTAHKGDDDPEFGQTRTVTGYGDSFVIASDKGAVRYDSNCQETGRIKFNTYISEPLLGVQRGKVYLSDNGKIYLLDFDNMKMEYKGNPNSSEDLGKQVFNGFDRTGRDTCFPIETYLNSSYFWEADLEDMSVHKTAKASNIVLMPPRYRGYESLGRIYEVDKLHYIKPYEYDNHDMDIILISPDTETDYASREKIVCGGVNIFGDDLIRQAQYMFNTSRSDYYLELLSMGDEYDLSFDDQADRFRMDVMSDIQKGCAPDIFYGNEFDYIYWGRNGIVLDMKPYLLNGGFDQSSVLPNIYDLMTDDSGEIYQVFSCFWMTGYWGRYQDYKDTEITIEGLKDGKITNGYSKPGASELLFNIFGYDLDRMYRNGDLTEERVREAVSFALDKGTGTEDYRAYDSDDLQNGVDASSTVDESVYNALSYYSLKKLMKDDPVFVGYPTFGKSIKTIIPESMTAVYSGTKHPEACVEFVSFLVDEDFQRELSMNGIFIPVNQKVFDGMMDYIEDPEKIPEDLKDRYRFVVCSDWYEDEDGEHSTIVPLGHESRECFDRQVRSCNALMIHDWGIRKLISEEIGEYYSHGKSIDEVAGSLYSRLKVYASENYG